MTKESISSTLRKLREGQKMSVKDVQERLLQFGISVSIKTIYGWESGKRLPDADTFLTLCDIYKSEDVLGDFGYRRIENYELNAAQKRTDINVPEDIDTSENDVFDNF